MNARRRIVGYIAASLDGFIAGPGDDLAFLDGEDGGPHRFEDFLATVGTVVMGRATHDVIGRLGPWPYAGKRGFVVTSRPLAGAPEGVDPWPGGDLEGLVALLRQGDLPPGDVWIVGGGRLQAAMLALGALDRLELFLTGALLGGGVRLFPEGTGGRLALVEAGRAGSLARLVFEARPRGGDGDCDLTGPPASAHDPAD